MYPSYHSSISSYFLDHTSQPLPASLSKCIFLFDFLTVCVFHPYSLSSCLFLEFIDILLANQTALFHAITFKILTYKEEENPNQTIPKKTNERRKARNCEEKLRKIQDHFSKFFCWVIVWSHCHAFLSPREFLACDTLSVNGIFLE